MPDQLGIFNEAARICGQSDLQNIDEQSETGRQLRNSWLPAVRYCFEQSGWQITEKRAILARSATAPAFGYAYYYNLPADCLRVLAVSETGEPDDAPLRWRLEGGQIASDAETIYLLYATHDKMALPGQWSQTFGDWVAAEIASRVAPRLNPKAVELAMGLAKKRRVEARNLDAMQQPAKQHRPSSWAMAPRSGRNTEQGR